MNCDIRILSQVLCLELKYTCVHFKRRRDQGKYLNYMKGEYLRLLKTNLWNHLFYIYLFIDLFIYIYYIMIKIIFFCTFDKNLWFIDFQQIYCYIYLILFNTYFRQLVYYGQNFSFLFFYKLIWKNFLVVILDVIL